MTTSFSVLASLDVALAVRRHLALLSSIRNVLGPTGSDSEGLVWLFPRDLSVVVEGSAQVAATVSVAGSWARPNPHNTAQFPRLRLDLYADSSRTLGKIARRDSEARAWFAWAPFNRELHRSDGFAEIWGALGLDPGLRVWGSSLLSHPDTFDTPDWDGGTHLVSYYGLCVG